MEWKMEKRGCTSRKLSRRRCVDRLTSLPDELLIRILCLLPTKDAAATQVLSNRMRQCFPLITSLDLDDSSICNCPKRPRLVDRFPLFESFIDNVLGKLSPDQSLTQFRLRLGRDSLPGRCLLHKNRNLCFPCVKPAGLNKWISYPLDNYGLRELDLSFHVGNASECKLPPRVFDYPSLQVLKLSCNLKIGGDGLVIRLPNLKVLQLHSFLVTEDDFLTRLVSQCPSLEELFISFVWEKKDRIVISSHSLRRLDLCIKASGDYCNSDLVLIETPNLQYFKYRDNLSQRYSFPHLNSLVEAHIDIVLMLAFGTFETSTLVHLSLFSALSHVQHLSLLGKSAEIFHLGGGLLKDQLPVFRNLTTLELGSFWDVRWDFVLLLILRSSPLLETLVFTQGFSGNVCADQIYEETAVLEAEGWLTNQESLPCFSAHLQRIELKCCFGFDRELNMIKFLLSKACVLKEFVICRSSPSKYISVYNEDQIEDPDFDQFERRLLDLPRASNSCSLIVNR